MKKRSADLVVIMLCLLIIVSNLIFTQISSTKVQPVDIPAEEGNLFISKSDIGMQKKVLLQGQWEFYWDKLYEGTHAIKDAPDGYAMVPGTWTKYEGKSYPPGGCATYRLHVDTNMPAGTKLGIYIGGIRDTYKLFVNDTLATSFGVVADKKNDDSSFPVDKAAFFETPAKEFDLVIQVSNFRRAGPGIVTSPFIAQSTVVEKNLTQTNMIDGIFIGAVFVIFLYFLFISILQTKLNDSFNLSIVAALILFTNFQVMHDLLYYIPWLSIDSACVINYSSQSWLGFFLIKYFGSLYKSTFSVWAQRVFLIAACIWQALILALPSLRYASIARYPIWHFDCISMYTILAILCCLVIFVLGALRKQRDAILNIICLLLSLAGFLNIYGTYMQFKDNSLFLNFYLTLFLVAILQMIIQARRVREYYYSMILAKKDFLQAQIKPHFLYNSLGIIIAILQDNPDTARHLLMDFKEYLQNSFNLISKNQYTLLQDEIRLAQVFINISKYRFENRLEINFEVPEKLDYKVPVCILQPIIENAIIHGVLAKPEGGRVDIHIAETWRYLVFQVTDNGVGISAEKIKKMLDPNENSRVGIANISERLKLIYGTKLNIISLPDNGTTVSWRILKEKYREEFQ